MSAPKSGTPETGWRISLAVLGVLSIIAAVVLEVVLLRYHQFTRVVATGKSPNVTTATTTGPSAPPASTVVTVFTLGVLALLVAAFFARISKIVFPGGELDIDSGAQLAAAVVKKTRDPQKAAELYRKAAPQAAQRMAQKASTGRRLARFVWPTSVRLNEQEMNDLVKDVAGPSQEADQGVGGSE